MALLEMHHAGLAERGGGPVPPVSLRLEEAARLCYACLDGETAGMLAMLACALRAPTSGAVYVGGFDTRMQPVYVKRIAAFVPHDALAPGFASFDAYIEYRAALHGIERGTALKRAAPIASALRGVHEAFAYPLAGALIAQPRLLVLDRPGRAYAPQISALTQQCAVFSTHSSEEEASAFMRAAPLA